MSQPDPANLSYQGVVYDRDAEHLRILSICWYVLAGLAALGGCLPLFHVTFGILMITGNLKGGGGPPPPAFVGWMFFVMGLIFSLRGWGAAVLGFFTARSLPQRRRIVLCYIAAGFACLQIPIGTTLGVFTFVVLSRPSIRATFT